LQQANKPEYPGLLLKRAQPSTRRNTIDVKTTAAPVKTQDTRPVSAMIKNMGGRQASAPKLESSQDVIKMFNNAFKSRSSRFLKHHSIDATNFPVESRITKELIGRIDKLKSGLVFDDTVKEPEFRDESPPSSNNSDLDDERDTAPQKTTTRHWWLKVKRKKKS
jgi:hypothetical protein